MPVTFTARDVLSERAAEINTYMMSMGLSPVAYYFSHLLSAVSRLSLILFICSLPIALALQHTGLVFLLLTMLYAGSAAAMTLLVVTLLGHWSIVAYGAVLLVNVGLTIMTVICAPLHTHLLQCFLFSLCPMTAYKLVSGDHRGVGMMGGSWR